VRRPEVVARIEEEEDESQEVVQAREEVLAEVRNEREREEVAV
jgi:hypothetical protein